MRPWQTIERIDTPEGALELRQRGERDFLITVAGRVLMTSAAHRSEDDLATLACAALGGRPRVRVLLGGLGMGYTLRAALDALPASAQVMVVDLNPCVVAWCKGPLGILTARAIEDRRVKVEVNDVARHISAAPPSRYDAILLDLYEGPHPKAPREEDSLYGGAALARAHTALREGGVLAIWSEEPNRIFEARFSAAGFSVEKHRGGHGGRAHMVYLGTRD